MNKVKNRLAAYYYQSITKIKILVAPKDAFRIHPHVERKVEGVLVTNYEQKWYLVNNDLLQDHRIPGLLRASLYEGFDENSNRFLLISTYPLSQESTEWRQSVLDIVAKARKQWVIMQRKKKGDGYRYQIDPDIDIDLRWANDDFLSFVTSAFGNNIIDTESDFLPYFLRVRKGVVVVRLKKNK